MNPRSSYVEKAKKRSYSMASPAVLVQKQSLKERPIPERLTAALAALNQRLCHCLEQYPLVPIPPVGDFLLEGVQAYLDILGMTKKELALLWDLQPSNLQKYLQNERTLRPRLAAKMALTFEVDPKLLLRVVAHHQLQACAEEQPAYPLPYSKANLLKRHMEK